MSQASPSLRGTTHVPFRHVAGARQGFSLPWFVHGCPGLVLGEHCRLPFSVAKQKDSESQVRLVPQPRGH